MQSKVTDKNAKNQIKTRLQAFLGIMNYLGMFVLTNAEICEPLCRMTSIKSGMDRSKIYMTEKFTHQNDACMIFYDRTEPLYLETDVSEAGLGAGPL